jgi:hydroxymethylglutaryl-CoA lyase
METTFIPTELKVDVINRVAQAGVRKIEATSFVNPRVIPQMADSDEVMRRIERLPGVEYAALIPNARGARRAVDVGADSLRLVVCCTETYNLRNVGMSVRQSVEQAREILGIAAAAQVNAEVTLALSFGCPFEGVVPEDRVVGLARELVGMGFKEICIADSIGVANPIQMKRLMNRLALEVGARAHLSLHLHDTRGLGLANVVAALECGIDTFDASLGGLGGCPIMVGGTGNIPTEGVVNLCDELGIATGIDIAGIQSAARLLQDFLGRELPSPVLKSGTRAQLFARTADRGPQ